MKLKYLILPLAFAAVATTGCQKASEYTPSIYVTEAQINPAKTITITEEANTATLSVSSSLAVAQDTHITLEVCPELLEHYNTTYGRKCKLLEDYQFDKSEVTIKSGKSTSDSGTITVSQKLEVGTFYCLPVKIVKTDGAMPVLEPSSTLYLVFRAPVHSKAVYLGSNMYVIPAFNGYKAQEGKPDPAKMSEMTLECRVMAKAFQGSNPYISSVIGLEGNLCIRFGDVKIGKDVVQVCKGDYQPAAIKDPCQPNQWYHLAAVWSRSSLKIYINGRFITESPNRGEMIDITQIPDGKSSSGFSIGTASVYDRYRPLDGYVAEARLWTRALTGTEIVNLNDLVVVDPKTPDLLAYWKMDKVEAASQTAPGFGWQLSNKVTDLTGNGFDAYGRGNNATVTASAIDTTW